MNRQGESIESDINSGFDVLVKECDELFSKIIQLHAPNGFYLVKSFEETLIEYLDEEDDNTMIFILNWLKLLLNNFKGDLFSKFNEFINKFIYLITSNNEIVNTFFKMLDLQFNNKYIL